jgi:uncharacterized protein YndB with AHSA1/START domain
MAQDWTSFSLQIAVKATLQQMYHAWTKPNEIEKWFLKSCTYLNNNSPIEKHENVNPNNTYEWTWFLYDITEKGTVTKANNKDAIQFTFAGNCLVDVSLAQKGDYVMVTLNQHEIPTDEKSKFNIHIGCLQGWTFYFANLKSVYEGGLDLRNQIPELKGVNN